MSFEKEARTAFTEFLRENNVHVLVAHNGKRYDHRIMAFHHFDPPVNVKAADSIVSKTKCLTESPYFL